MWNKNTKRIRLLKGVEGISDDIRDILDNRCETDDSILGIYDIPEIEKIIPYSCEFVVTEYHNESKVFARCSLGIYGMRLRHTDEGIDFINTNIYIPLISRYETISDLYNVYQHEKYRVVRFKERNTPPVGLNIEKIEFISDVATRDVNSKEITNRIKEEIEEAIEFYGINYGFADDFSQEFAVK